MRRVLIFGVLLIVAGLGACTLLLPERFAINAPVLHLLLGRGVASPEDAIVRARLHAAAGLEARRYATDLPNVRMLTPTPAGDLIASLGREGKVVLVVRDRNRDGHSDETRELLTGLRGPTGLELHDGWLYVGEIDAVRRVRFDADSGTLQGELEPFITGLPDGGNHWTRTLRFGPDGHWYVSVGSSCNVCEEADPRRAAILRYAADGSGEEIFASGLRNAVGFDWQPGTGQLYATDNGRDLLGDDLPPCELNRVEAGGFYGWPYANGDKLPDPDFGAGNEARVRDSIPPAFPFRAHNAPLGIHFVRDPGAPAELRGAALVALHGSWNRTRKDGYKVVSLHWGPDGKIRSQDFLTGFEKDGNVIGRPVDVVEGFDGIYVSDDYAGTIYRLRPRLTD